MNLKEAFRYQRFLSGIMQTAAGNIRQREHCLTTTKIHYRSKANPDAQDEVEVVERESTYYKNDDVIALMQQLVEEREALSRAIGVAKASLNFDMDAAVETNKFRQILYRALDAMMCFSTSKKVEQGRDYKFNIAGDQSPYYYDVEVATTEAYDKYAAKQLKRSMVEDSDNTSAMIDAAIINATVDYTPLYNVNDSFEDVMEEFLQGRCN